MKISFSKSNHSGGYRAGFAFLLAALLGAWVTTELRAQVVVVPNTLATNDGNSVATSAIFIFMEKKIISTKSSPVPVGPYNQAILFGNMLFVSGQVALDPKTSNIVLGDIKEEAEQVMKNLQAILQEAGMDFSNVLKASVFLTDLSQSGEINAVFAKYCGKTAPARETVQVVSLPLGLNVEISLIAGK